MNGIHEVRGSIPLASMELVLKVGRGTQAIDNCQLAISDFQLLFFGGLTAKVVGRAGIAQLVEHNLAKVGVAGSSPVSRSRRQGRPEETSRGGAVW